ncbi:hypothetical protein L484_024946 [Morus notabilis]|uniref:Uncharacterized protein n=1 Tax=Morus notabilis TaxID=981085 RepID=W9RRU9_9ROSA|nr:hypothetical protein L484_024946 [Morus notabilis]
MRVSETLGSIRGPITESGPQLCAWVRVHTRGCRMLCVPPRSDHAPAQTVRALCIPARYDPGARLLGDFWKFSGQFLGIFKGFKLDLQGLLLIQNQNPNSIQNLELQ